MRIQHKVLTSIIITFCILFGIAYLLSNTILLRSFVSLEEFQINKNIDRIINTIDTEINDLVLFNADWAAWDDSYEFIINGEPDFIKKNIVNASFEDSRLDFMVFVNIEGEIVYGRQYDFEKGVQIRVSDKILEHIKPGNLLLKPRSAEEALGGIIRVGERFFIVASYPILNSNRKGEPRGILLMGRMLDKQLLTRVSKTTQVEIGLIDINDLTPKETLIVDNAPRTIDYPNDNTVFSYILFKDIFNNPVFYIKTKSSRGIYQQGLRDTSYMLLTLLMSVTVIVFLLVVVINKIVVTRISSLESSVRDIEDTQNYSKRIESENNGDEISSLETQINSLLEAIQITHNQLESSRSEAERSSMAKSEFLTSMSHELRTPLNAILGYSQLIEMRSKNLTEDEKEWVAEIITAGEYLLKLISELLDLSSIESGVIELDIEPIVINDVVNSAISMVKPLASKNAINLIACTKELEGLTMNADKTRLSQILINLLSNAIKYNKNKGTVDLNTAKIGQYCFIKISDTGIGISKEQLGEIFDPFQRADAVDSGVEGVGIGLSITRRLVEAMNGRIDVKSKVNVGTVFTVVLPVK